MREIKFRVWINNRMILPYDDWSNYHSIDLEWQICDVWDQNLQLNEDEWFILMQYTWLKDNNGKDIYEGDIISYYNPDNFEKNQEVVWDDISLCYWCGTHDIASLKHIQDNMIEQFKFQWKFEVIWNIYENPELIKN